MRISKRYIAIQVLIITAIFAAGELFTRWQGYAPGDLRPNWSNFHPVDSLKVYDEFIVDSNGILIANKERFKAAGLSINSDGFRTGEFAAMDSIDHKILLIGDSYTWGLTAKPLNQCFADLLNAELKGRVINMGIPSADPAQYDAIAQRYIPRIKPETVVVMFYLGNDIMAHPRPIIPYQPFYYYTNAGAIMADDGDIHFNSAQEAYEYYTRRKFFLLHPANFAETIISHSALLSRIYSHRYRWSEKMAAEHAIADMSVTKRYLYSIANVCRQNNCRLQIILIPEIKEAGRPTSFFEKRYKSLMSDSILARHTYIPDGNSPDNYVDYPDGHLNNAGHAFYARKMAAHLAEPDSAR